MGSIENLESTVEARSISGSAASIRSTGSRSSQFDREINDFDDRKTPPVFGRLWRECVSIATLACAPGLNVLTFLYISDSRP
jgi:hypothetical protein